MFTNLFNVARHLTIALLLGVCMAAQVQAQWQTDSVRFQAAASMRALQHHGTRLAQPDPNRLEIRLPFPSPEELAILDEPNDAQVVGFGRALPVRYAQAIDTDELSWIETTDGGLVATLSVYSPNASALRLKIVLQASDNVEMIFSSDDGMFVEALDTADAATQPARFWSPTVSGDTLLMELYLPPGMLPEDLVLSLPLVSHLGIPPLDDHLAPRRLREVGRSGSCNIDVACQDAGIPSAIVDSVAKYFFSNSQGQSFLCSGQLLNDTDPTSQVPYFLTADHCINKQDDASSIEFYWFFQRSTCGSPAPGSVVRTVGGATLLANGRETDFSLLRLNNEPPNGVGLSGWDSNPLPLSSPVYGIHHPGGDLKKISYGSTLRHIAVQGQSTRDDFVEVSWTHGITEPGSSGSGLWHESNGIHRLIGTLMGGFSTCEAPAQPDYYGRFDRTFPSIESYLVPPKLEVDDTPRLLNISTNGQVANNGGMIAGFIVTGTSAKRIVVMGEDMGGLDDPEIRVVNFSTNQELGYNNDWQSSANAEEIRSRLRAPGKPKDAALVLTLEPGVYLATLTGRNGGTGRGLVSVNEIGGSTGGRLLNISTNGDVDSERGLIAGFIVTGNGPKRMAIMGEDMGGLTDPEIQVVSFPQEQVLTSNDNWQSSATSDELVAKLRAPGKPKDAGLVMTLNPGAYLVYLRDRAGQGGRGMVSVTEIAP